MISIIIPTYNDTNRLEQALKSIAKQTVQDIEVIIVDDCSDEWSEKQKLVAQFSLPITLYRLESHSGANGARNYGFEKSSGDYVIFWDDDVVGKADMLEKMLRALEEHSDASYAYARHYYGFKKFPLQKFDAEDLKKKNFAHTTSLIRREHFPGFDPALKRLQDWDLWLTLLEQGHTGVFVPEYLFKIQTGGTMSSWLPKYAYMKSFRYLLPRQISKQVEEYERAVQVIQKKHSL